MFRSVSCKINTVCGAFCVRATRTLSTTQYLHKYIIVNARSCEWQPLPRRWRQYSSDINTINNHNKEEIKQLKRQRTSIVLYCGSVFVLFIGLTYAAVPAYRAFCQQMGWGGKAEQTRGHRTDKVATMTADKTRQLRVHFNADTASSMRWNFKPIQHTIKLFAGETALAFYSARNPHSKPVTGISTYNIIPIEAGLYFNKIQCFCFEEQRLNPGEQVDMPVFFYIDPDFCFDPKLENVNDIWLSYHFFEARPGLQLPLPDEFVPVMLKSESENGGSS